MKIFIPILLISTMAASAIGQHWQKVVTPWVPVTNYYQIPYFLNADLGFVYNSVSRRNILLGNPYGISTASFYRTMDGGQTWSFVQPFNGENVSIQQLTFTSLSHGYVVIDSTDNNGFINGIIYETADTGNTWQRISPPGFSVYTVYGSHGAIFAAAGAPRIYDNSWYATMGVFPYAEAGTLYQSTDDGATWVAVPGIPGPMIAQVTGNRDSLVFVLSMDGSTQDFLNYSTDLGRHWTHTLLAQYGGAFTNFIDQSATVAPYSCQIDRMWDGAVLNGQDVISVFTGDIRSSPLSWRTITVDELGAWINGTRCARYFSNAVSPTPDSGLIRLIGDDTTYVGGPNLLEIDDVDYPNISVVGHGAIVYVSSPWGAEELWKTTDGGDGKLSASALAPQFALGHNPFPGNKDTLFIDACTAIPLMALNQNMGCSYAKFDSISVTGLTPSEYSILASAHHSVCDDVQDTSFLTLEPMKNGIKSFTIHYYFTDDEFGRIDTGMNVIMSIKPGGRGLGLHVYLKPAALTPKSGDTIDIPIYITGFDTLSGMTAIDLPVAIDTNILHVVGFHPAVSGADSTNLSYANDTEMVHLRVSGLAVNGETLLGTLRCVIYLAKTLQISVSLAEASINASDPRCITLSTDAGTVGMSITGCGSSTILSYLQSGLIPFGIRPIHPNPASNMIIIDFINTNSSFITYEVVDALGTTRNKGETSGVHAIVDTHSLQNGCYTLKARNETGWTVLSRFIVAQ